MFALLNPNLWIGHKLNHRAIDFGHYQRSEGHMVNMQALLHLDLNCCRAAEMAKQIERIEESKKRILLCTTLGVVGTPRNGR